MLLYTYKKSRRAGHLKSRPFSRLASARALTNLIDVIKRVKVVKGGVCWGGSSFSTRRGSLSLCGRVWWSNRPHYLNPHTLWANTTMKLNLSPAARLPPNETIKKCRTSRRREQTNWKSETTTMSSSFSSGAPRNFASRDDAETECFFMREQEKGLAINFNKFLAHVRALGIFN